MTNLTEAMMHLREEINTWRHARVSLRNDLMNETDTRRVEVSELCAGYRADRAGAEQAWSGLTPSTRAAAKAPVKSRVSDAPKAAPKAAPKQVELAAPPKATVPESKPELSREHKPAVAEGRVKPSPIAMTTHTQKSPSKARRAR